MAKKKYSEKDLAGKDKIVKLKKCTKDVSGISLDPMLMYVIVKMDDLGIRLSEPNIAIAAHRVFPKYFSIYGWEKYPCTKRIDTGMLHLRYKDKVWVKGTCNQYIITKKGRKIAEDFEKLLDGVNDSSNLVKRRRSNTSKTRKPDKLITQIKKTETFVKYKCGDIDDITQFEIYNILQCTLDSSVEVVRENYDSLCILAESSGDTAVIDFLTVIKPKVMEVING
jgi:hypothetical protein